MSTTDRRHTPAIFYRYLHDLLRHLPKTIRAMKADTIDKAWSERIMLAVTHVNDCPLCSYAHSKIALEEGMSEQEIRCMLSGEFSAVPAHQLESILFAQHYADSIGEPSQEALDRIMSTYTEQECRAILARIRIISFGNIYGYALWALKQRIKGDPPETGSPLEELEVVFTILVTPLLALRYLPTYLNSDRWPVEDLF